MTHHCPFWFWTVTLLILSLRAIPVQSSSPPDAILPPSKVALVVDVDNTLYQETHAGIERQIVANTHAYCRRYLRMSPRDADALFREYGSTVEGLRRTLWRDEEDPGRHLAHFYEHVYTDIDMSKLLPPSSEGGGSSTGYGHGRRQRALRRLLRASPNPIVWASNSPSWHVRRVLRGMGIADSTSAVGMITPDASRGYPTKHAAKEFFGDRLEDYERLVVLDDSEGNLERICAAFENAVGVRICHDADGDGPDLPTALSRQWGLIDRKFAMDPVRYLQSKNIVDRQSLHVETWEQVVQILSRTARDRPTVPLQIVDLGAGLLSMLDLLIKGDPDRTLSSLLPSYEGPPIHYKAYESNKDLATACQDRLQRLGFVLEEQLSEDEYLYTHPRVRLSLLMRDFDDETIIDPIQHVPDLIVGCCFADLTDPYDLVPSLIRRFHLQGARRNTLLYFPITFCGTTQFMPPQPFEDEMETGSKIPSDTLAFQLYSRSLSETMGHNLDIRSLVRAMEGYGVKFVSGGRSNWTIDSLLHPYLYETMLFFFGSSAGPELLERGWDAGAWIKRARKHRPTIVATNTDLLFEVNAPSSIQTDCENKEGTKAFEEIQFVAPKEVTTVRREFPELGPNEVLVKSSYSLISSGTELKIYNGIFDDAALDVNIKGMEEERMAYPLSYGYCLVGTIDTVGSDVPTDLIGKLVFTFSAHASHVVTNADAVQFVPDGIDAKDAIFMPAVETALSLVHDANVRVGENIAIYGQGLIGLLVTKLLSMHNKPRRLEPFGTITTFDTLSDRLAASSDMGASQALLPGGSSGPFDVAIEVSGNARALQSAIDHTSNGGRVIVGSWYGNADVRLQLGIDFHRSHKTIQTSQVSEIPATLSGLWDKRRRFALSWELVRQIAPSRLLTRTTTLSRAGDAYEALQNGSEIAIAFDYSL